MHFLLEWCIAQIKKLLGYQGDIAVILANLQNQINTIIEGGITGSGVGVTENRASLKLIPLDQRPHICFIEFPEDGVQKVYRWALGSTETADDFSVIDPGDSTGRWIQYL